MQKRFLPLIGLLVGVLPLIGCASIMKGSNQKLKFQSQPEGAKVSVFDDSGMLVADSKTPVTIPLKKSGGYFQPAKYKVVFEAPGYEKKEIWLSGSLEAGWYLAGNFLVGGMVGWLIVDPLTGAMWKLEPSTVSTNLDKSIGMSEEGALRVVLASQVAPEVLAMATPIGSAQ
jgi:hypothetical protein